MAEDTNFKFDGLCGIIGRFTVAGPIRCKFELGHVGAHSWEKYKEQFKIQSHCGCSPEQVAEEGFINSVLGHKK